MDYQSQYNVLQGIPYNIPGISVKEAAIAATAAASGQGYPPYIPLESLQRASPSIGGGNSGIAIKKERGSSLPQPISFPMTQTQQLQHPQSVFVDNQEEPRLYVNAKQFYRILKRRVTWQRLEEAFSLKSKGRKSYLHESRHNYAMRRPRGLGGRFLTAEEIERSKGECGKGGGDLNATSKEKVSNASASLGTSEKVNTN